MLIVLALLALLEVMLYWPPLWRRGRMPYAIILLALVLAASIAYVQLYFIWISSVFVYASLFRSLNLVRVIKGRMHQAYLRRVCLRTSLWLLPVQLLLAVIVRVVWSRPHDWRWQLVLTAIAAVQLIASVVVQLSVSRAVVKMKVDEQPALDQSGPLPTVTVAIPARNETTSLSECLQQILASDYPKLEILVLDDCSQDATSEVIKSFAHAGVRFLLGKEPAPNWLAKNQAYEQLLQDAAGQYVLFCGVDSRIGPQTISELVALLRNRGKSMVSVLPKHVDAGAFGSAIQPMRYWWELALPRRFLNRPAVLSTVWMAKKEFLLEAGGFKAVSQSVVPEGYFARQAVKADGYSFVRSHNRIEVFSVKNFSEQYERAVRIRYPEVHRRMELVALLAFAEICLLLAPFLLFWVALWHGYLSTALVFALVISLLVDAHMTILRLTSRLHPLVAVFNFPFILLFELFVSLKSMLQYEFAEVDWRGRNICLPAMHTMPHLPPLEPTYDGEWHHRRRRHHHRRRHHRHHR